MKHYSIERLEVLGIDPVSLEAVKANMREDGDDQDTRIDQLIQAATKYIEDARSQVLRRSTFTMTLERWPRDGRIEIPRFPVTAVNSVTYLAEGASEATTFAATNYRLEAAQRPPRIVLKSNKVWPSATLETGAPITVTFTAGYPDGQVPEDAQQAIHLLVAHWYENREGVVIGTISGKLPLGIHDIVLSERQW